MAFARILAVLLLLATTPLGSMTEPQTIDGIRVLKSERKLLLLHGRKIVHEFPIALGFNPTGHKQQEGDGRTPEGHYRIDYRKQNSSYYRALRISYPSAADVADARKRGVAPGGAIMIHGQPNGWGWTGALLQKRDWTYGCIALGNDEMGIVWESVAIGTPIEILP